MAAQEGTQHNTLAVNTYGSTEHDGMAAQEGTQHTPLEVNTYGSTEHDGMTGLIVGQDPKDEKVLGYSSEKMVNYNKVGKQATLAEAAEPLHSTTGRRILGLKRKTFFVLSAVSLVLVIAGAIGGGVGGTKSIHNRRKAATDNLAPSAIIPSSSTPSSTSTSYANTGMAAMKWIDVNSTAHKRVYYQDQNNKIVESAWDNSSTFDALWEVNTISDAMKPGTPIAAVAGYPGSSYDLPLVRAYLVLLLSMTNSSEGQKCVLHVS